MSKPKNRAIYPIIRTSKPYGIPVTSIRPTNSCLIYVFGDIGGKGSGRIMKIGKTRNLADISKTQHESRGPHIVPMEYLAGVWGHDSDERAIKDWIRSLGIVTNGKEEWVYADPDTAGGKEFRAWVRFLRLQDYVATSTEEIESLTFVDSKNWLPTGDNFSRETQSKLPLLDSCSPFFDLEVEEMTEGDYYTNATLIEAITVTMGGAIDLDPSSCRMANSVVRARRFYGALVDGLQQEWRGRVWLNPPFGQWGMWAPKAIQEWKSGRIGQMGIFMTANAATSKQVGDLLRCADAVYISAGRYNCWGPKATQAAEGSIIVYYGPNRDVFYNAFRSYGSVHFNPVASFGRADRWSSEGV